ncbi:hypothetical protein [Prosthecobacter sp.]|uniref:hypothetical protein n=1 Tax=Prosthecobacter sp. TaxID=1965333 RepID=UPI002ABA1585|nr:hypothetical protein [Prosthecobacter sp.]MDZ4404140.1 hypothetical protein [Prosthecobacter sp.]
MKTKFTLLLALAVSASAYAEKPNFNGFKPSTRSVPSASNGSSRSVNAGQIIGIARSVLPHLLNATQPPPPLRSAAPRVAMPKSSAKPSVSVKKPATRLSPPASGLDSKTAAGLLASREIAEGLKSLGSLRGSFGGVEGFRDVFHQPGNPGPKVSSRVTDPFADADNYERTPTAPAHITGSNGLTDIRGGGSNARKGTDADVDNLTSTTQRVVESGSRILFGSGSASTADSAPETRPDQETGEMVVSQTGTDSNGNRARLDVVQDTDADGNVIGTTEIAVVATDTSTRVTSTLRDSTGAIVSTRTTLYNTGRRSVDRTPGDISMGGPVNGTGPSVGEVSGLVPLDLLRQHANGETNGHGATNYTITRSSGAAQVRPVGEGAQTGITTRAKPRTLTGQGLEGGSGGGDLPD